VMLWIHDFFVRYEKPEYLHDMELYLFFGLIIVNLKNSKVEEHLISCMPLNSYV